MKLSFVKLFAVTIIILFSNVVFAQSVVDSSLSNSLAFKRNKPREMPPLYFSQEYYNYHLQERFQILRLANAGDPNAQHELGLRYLLGRGFPADTVVAVYWMQRSADQNHIGANYNLAICMMNGWGTPWDPYSAFNRFLFAAQNGMSSAQYAIGLFYLEDLVVKRNLQTASEWVKSSIQGGYKEANETLLSINERIEQERKAKKDDEKKSVLLFIEFDVDTTKVPSDTLLIEDYQRSITADSSGQNNSIFKTKEQLTSDTTEFNKLKERAVAGSPEGMTLLGYLYLKGIGTPKQTIHGASLLLQAIRLESLRAARILVDMVQSTDFSKMLIKEVNSGNREARYVIAGMNHLGLDNQLTKETELRYLRENASNNHIPSLLELGSRYYSGEEVVADYEKAFDFWAKAADAGSLEAMLKLSFVQLLSGRLDGISTYVPLIEEAEQSGSITAQIALGYCYEMGYGVQQNKAEAAQLYRKAAMRGSQNAFNALKKLYDVGRPVDPTFN